jgi:predicted phosphohydrolase
MPRRIWAIADTHLSFANPKPMDVFGPQWTNHPQKILDNCRKVIAEDDLLLIPGDLSWAMRFDEAEPDLAFLASLPGIKVVGKGNHDYWWGSDKPLRFPGLNDTPYISEDGLIGVAATRGWTSLSSATTNEERTQSAKIIAREANRLTKRLEAVSVCPIKFALIHHPPLPDFLPVLKQFGVQDVLYGHVHLGSSDAPLPEDWNGIRCLCVAADRLGFMPRLVRTL